MQQHSHVKPTINLERFNAIHYFKSSCFIFILRYQTINFLYLDLNNLPATKHCSKSCPSQNHRNEFLELSLISRLNVMNRNFHVRFTTFTTYQLLLASHSLTFGFGPGSGSISLSQILCHSALELLQQRSVQVHLAWVASVALEGVAEKQVAHMEHHHPKVALDRTVRLLKAVHFVLKFDHMIMISDIVFL